VDEKGCGNKQKKEGGQTSGVEKEGYPWIMEEKTGRCQTKGKAGRVFIWVNHKQSSGFWQRGNSEILRGKQGTGRAKENQRQKRLVEDGGNESIIGTLENG